MQQTARKTLRRSRRQRRVRKRVTGTGERPRLTVFRSHKHTYGQIIDDHTGRTIAAACTLQKDLRETLGGAGGNRAAARAVGQALAAKARGAGVTKVVFDRSGYPYHGRVRELAEAARKGGLEF